MTTFCFVFELLLMADSEKNKKPTKKGDHGIDRGRVSINYEFSDEEYDGLKPINFEAYPCNMKVPDGKLKGFTNVTTCSCSYCEKSCNVTRITFVPPTYFEGFNLLLVAAVYMVLFVIVILTYYISQKVKKITNAYASEKEGVNATGEDKIERLYVPKLEQ